MSKDLGRLRRNRSFILATAYLEENGVAFEIMPISKHPCLLVKAPTGPFRFSFCNTPSDHRSPLNDLRKLKHRLAAAV